MFPVSWDWGLGFANLGRILGFGIWEWLVFGIWSLGFVRLPSFFHLAIEAASQPAASVITIVCGASVSRLYNRPPGRVAAHQARPRGHYVLDSFFQLLFRYRPVVFQQGEFRLVPSTGSYVAAVLVVVAIVVTVLTYRSARARGAAIKHRLVL